MDLRLQPKKITFLYFLFLFSLTFFIVTDSFYPMNTGYAADNGSFVITRKIRISKNRVLDLKLYGRESDREDPKISGFNKIMVYENKHLIQTILIKDISESKENYTECNYPKDSGITIEDMDFNGSEDFRLIEFMPASPNIPYFCFLWDEKKERFYHSKQLDEITSPEFDPAKKIIYSEIKDSAAKYINNTYKYLKNGKLVLIKSVVSEWVTEVSKDGTEKDFVNETTFKLIDGKMQITHKTKKSAE